MHGNGSEETADVGSKCRTGKELLTVDLRKRESKACNTGKPPMCPQIIWEPAGEQAQLENKGRSAQQEDQTNPGET